MPRKSPLKCKSPLLCGRSKITKDFCKDEVGVLYQIVKDIPQSKLEKATKEWKKVKQLMNKEDMKNMYTRDHFTSLIQTKLNNCYVDYSGMSS